MIKNILFFLMTIIGCLFMYANYCYAKEFNDSIIGIVIPEHMYYLEQDLIDKTTNGNFNVIYGAVDYHDDTAISITKTPFDYELKGNELQHHLDNLMTLMQNSGADVVSSSIYNINNGHQAYYSIINMTEIRSGKTMQYYMGETYIHGFRYKIILSQPLGCNRGSEFLQVLYSLRCNQSN